MKESLYFEGGVFRSDRNKHRPLDLFSTLSVFGCKFFFVFGIVIKNRPNTYTRFNPEVHSLFAHALVCILRLLFVSALVPVPPVTPLPRSDGSRQEAGSADG